MLSHPFSENCFKYVLKSISNKPLGIDRSVYQQQQQQQQQQRGPSVAVLRPNLP